MDVSVLRRRRRKGAVRRFSLMAASGSRPGLEGHEETLAKFLLAAQKTRNEKIHKRPQVADIVFYRRSCQGYAVCRRDGPSGLGLFCFGVFDVLRFIQNNAAPGNIFQYRHISLKKPIA